MTPTVEQLQTEAAQRGKDPTSRRLLMLLSLVLALSIVTVAALGAVLWNEKQQQALAGKDLAIKVQQACVDPATKADLGKLCTEAKKVEEQIKAGPQGPPGLTGPPGADGVDGVDGTDGVDGKAGRNGADGQDGKDGVAGPAGPPGPAGQDGADGKDGQDGENAFPMTWTFQFQPNPAQTYSFLCTLIDPSQQVNCINQ